MHWRWPHELLAWNDVFVPEEHEEEAGAILWSSIIFCVHESQMDLVKLIISIVGVTECTDLFHDRQECSTVPLAKKTFDVLQDGNGRAIQCLSSQCSHCSNRTLRLCT